MKSIIATTLIIICINFTLSLSYSELNEIKKIIELEVNKQVEEKTKELKIKINQLENEIKLIKEEHKFSQNFNIENENEKSIDKRDSLAFLEVDDLSLRFGKDIETLKSKTMQLEQRIGNVEINVNNNYEVTMNELRNFKSSYVLKAQLSYLSDYELVRKFGILPNGLVGFLLSNNYFIQVNMLHPNSVLPFVGSMNFIYRMN